MFLTHAVPGRFSLLSLKVERPLFGVKFIKANGSTRCRPADDLAMPA